MTTEQFNQLQCLLTLDGLCYSLRKTADEIGDEVPEELEDAVESLLMSLRSFRASVETYAIVHKGDYIDKEGIDNEV